MISLLKPLLAEFLTEACIEIVVGSMELQVQRVISM